MTILMIQKQTSNSMIIAGANNKLSYTTLIAGKGNMLMDKSWKRI